MSFVLELEVAGLDWELAEQLERQTIDACCIAVHPGPRRRWLRACEPSLWMDDERDEVPVFSDQADLHEPAFTFDERGGELLTRTIAILDEALNSGWSLRAYWVADPLRNERDVTAEELSKLVGTSALDRKTRYHVKPS